MTYMDTTPVQSGWKVVDSNGKELGTVTATDEGSIQIKKDGLLGGSLSVPRDAVAEVETGRVELSMTKEEIEASNKGN